MALPENQPAQLEPSIALHTHCDRCNRSQTPVAEMWQITPRKEPSAKRTISSGLGGSRAGYLTLRRAEQDLACSAAASGARPWSRLHMSARRSLSSALFHSGVRVSRWRSLCARWRQWSVRRPYSRKVLLSSQTRASPRLFPVLLSRIANELVRALKVGRWGWRAPGGKERVR